MDTFEQFLQLLVDYNIRWIISKILDENSPVTQIFAGQALIRAVAIEDAQLIRYILHAKPPLDAEESKGWHKASDFAIL